MCAGYICCYSLACLWSCFLFATLWCVQVVCCCCSIRFVCVRSIYVEKQMVWSPYYGVVQLAICLTSFVWTSWMRVTLNTNIFLFFCFSVFFFILVSVYQPFLFSCAYSVYSFFGSFKFCGVLTGRCTVSGQRTTGQQQIKRDQKQAGIDERVVVRMTRKSCKIHKTTRISVGPKIVLYV